MTIQQWLELASASLGVAGSLLLATKCRAAGWAFVLWLASNAGWIAFGAAQGLRFLVAQHVVFAATSVLGIWTWLALPAMKRRANRWRCDLCGRDLTRNPDACPYPDCEYYRKGHDS